MNNINYKHGLYVCRGDATKASLIPKHTQAIGLTHFHLKKNGDVRDVCLQHLLTLCAYPITAHLKILRFLFEIPPSSPLTWPVVHVTSQTCIQFPQGMPPAGVDIIVRVPIKVVRIRIKTHDMFQIVNMTSEKQQGPNK